MEATTDAPVGALLQSATARAPRRYDIDALRVIAFGLLILYHVGMSYVLDWGWHVKSAYQTEALQLPMLMLNQWRMPLIFMISGLAMSFVIGKYDGWQLAGRRSVRLLVPLVFGMLVVVPPQAYYQALTNGVIEPGYGDFLWRYFSFQGWPEGAFDGSDPGITWNHLWYLPYLLTYTLLLIPLAAFLGGPGARIVSAFRKLRGAWLILIPILPLMLYGNFVFPYFPDITHDLINDGYAHVMYGTFFLYGFLMARDAGLWAEIARLRWVTLILAVSAFASLLFLTEVLPDDTSTLQDQALMVVIYLNRWSWLLLALGWGHHLLNRSFRWLPYATEAVYPWYILHQSIIVVVGYNLARFSLGAVVEPALVLAATVGGCLLIHEFVIRRTGWLRPLFGVNAVARSPVGRQEHAEMPALGARLGDVN